MGGRALYQSEQEKLARMERNMSLQYDAIRKLVEGSGGSLHPTQEIIKELHRIAMQDLYSCAGQFRDVRREPRRSSVAIRGSKHKRPEDDHVAGLVEDLCDTVNSIVAVNPIRAAAILMWKLCWIHPFHGGNGRTARAAAYLALCVGFNQFLPGRPTVVEQLDASRMQYIEALQDADSAWRESQVVDVTQMERLLEDMLKIQLAGPR
jgi:Fic family protein